MVVKGVRAQAATMVAAAGALTVLIGAAAMFVRPGGDALPAGAAMAAPPGNNGTIKIDGVELGDKPPENNPHQGCSFTVEFYNYEEGPYNAQVIFQDQAPTSDAGVQVVSGDQNPFIGGDPAGGQRPRRTRGLHGEVHRPAASRAGLPPQDHHPRPRRPG